MQSQSTNQDCNCDLIPLPTNGTNNWLKVVDDLIEAMIKEKNND